MNLGWTELLVILAIALLFFGPSRLPGLGKALGETIKGFKKGITEPDEKPAEIVHDSSEKEKTEAKEKEKQS